MLNWTAEHELLKETGMFFDESMHYASDWDYHYALFQNQRQYSVQIPRCFTEDIQKASHLKVNTDYITAIWSKHTIKMHSFWRN